MERIDVDIAIVTRGGKVLICRRRSDTPLGGYWEFPGGKRKAGETAGACIVREVLEELGIEVEPTDSFPVIEHDYPHTRVRLHPHLCRHVGGAPRPLGCEELLWIDPRALRDYRFPPANAQLIEKTIEHLTRDVVSDTKVPG